MDVYYKNELLNKTYNPITVKNIYGLEFLNGSKIIVNHTSVTSKCSNGKITSNGSDKTMIATISLPGHFSAPPINSIITGLLVPTMIDYDTTNGSSGYLTDKVVDTNCTYNSSTQLGFTGVCINIKFSSIPTNATKITAFFTYLFIFPN